MPAKSDRTARIEREMQRVLSELVLRDVKDPRVGAVTITAVQLSADRSTALIHFLPLRQLTGDVAAAADAAAGLASAAGYLRGELGRRLSLRHAPRLEFTVDHHLDEASRLTSLIDSAVISDRLAAADDSTD